MLVSTFGSREHYEVAAMAARAGVLDLLVTDLWNFGGPFTNLLDKRVVSPVLQRVLGRYRTEIPLGRVRHMPTLALRFNNAINRAQTWSDRFCVYAEFGAEYATKASGYLKPSHGAVFSYTNTSLELFKRSKALGVQSILGQIDPGRKEGSLVSEEAAMWPSLSSSVLETPGAYYDRVEQELALADTVIANSQWSKKLLVEAGVEAAKVHVVPLPYLGSGTPIVRRHQPELRVLYVGSLNVRKGVQYLAQAAHRMLSSPVRFDLVGPLELDLASLNLPANCNYHGSVPRQQVAKYMEHSSILLFPTLSDGFGMVQVEAIAGGLPVIATPRCGEVIEDGKSGLIIEAGSRDAIVAALDILLRREISLEQLSIGAIDRSKRFLPHEVWARYTAAFGRQK